MLVRRAGSGDDAIAGCLSAGDRGGMPVMTAHAKERQTRMLQAQKEHRTLRCRGKSLPLGERTLIMGILNVTPDSFSDGGNYTTVERAVRHAVQMAEDGADIIDIGGESTRPGFRQISAEEELERILPVIEAVRQEVDLPLSVDTYKAEVARQALEAGAHIINDIWGFQGDPDMATVAADYEAAVVLMHN